MRDLEKERQKGGNTFMADSLLEEEEASKNVSSVSAVSLGTSQLNQLWERMRYFLNGKDAEGNDLNNKAVGRARFTDICELKAMRGKSMTGVLPEKDVVQAFVSSRLLPLPSDAEFKALFKSLEAYHSEDLNLVNWRSILSATTMREQTSYRGIFPKIVSKIHPFFVSIITAIEKSRCQNLTIYHFSVFVNCRKSGNLTVWSWMRAVVKPTRIGPTRKDKPKKRSANVNRRKKIWQN